MKKITLITLMMLGASYGASAGVCSDRLCNGQIDSIHVNQNAKIYVTPDSDMTPLNCDLDNGALVLRKSNIMHSEIYSMLLTAKATKKDVRVRVNHLEGELCEILYVVL